MSTSEFPWRNVGSQPTRRGRPALAAQAARDHRRSATPAFTLLEVLMALVIFALAAVVLGSAYVNVLNSYDIAARGTVVDVDFAYARQVVTTEPDRTKLEQGGEFDTSGGRHVRWSVEITATTMPDLYNVAFTCDLSDPSRPDVQKLTETFVLLRPTWSIDPGEQGKLKEDVKARILEIQGKKQG